MEAEGVGLAMGISRKAFIKKAAVLSAMVLGQPTFAASTAYQKSSSVFTAFKLPTLPYEPTVFEPYIDEKTLRICYAEIQQQYVQKLNELLPLTPSLKGKNLDEIIKNISRYSPVVRNNAGGHWNYSFFWRVLHPSSQQMSPTPPTIDLMERSFGSFQNFKQRFHETAMSVFGSGWVWLVVKGGTLSVTHTANHDNPLMDVALNKKGNPVLALSVWEHAYYLKYQNRRTDYVNAFWNIVNWDMVHQLIDVLKYA